MAKSVTNAERTERHSAAAGLLDAAHAAARAAVTAASEQLGSGAYLEGRDEPVYVQIDDGTLSHVHVWRSFKNNVCSSAGGKGVGDKGVGDKGLPKGWRFYSPGRYAGDRAEVYVAASEAFAAVLRENGVSCRVVVA